MENTKIEEFKNLPIMKGIITTAERRIIEDISKEENIKDFLKDLRSFDLKYAAAIEEVETKLNILKEDFNTRYNKCPIEHIETRIKSPESLMKKAIRNGIPFNLTLIEENIHDIAGVRIICPFLSDIPLLVNTIKHNFNFEVIKEKDYVTNPKPSGYRSYHLILKVPIYLTTGEEKVSVEIQIRTIGMDFWASLEHQMKYKFDGVIPENVHNELSECSEDIRRTDERMMKILDDITELNAP